MINRLVREDGKVQGVGALYRRARQNGYDMDHLGRVRLLEILLICETDTGCLDVKVALREKGKP